MKYTAFFDGSAKPNPGMMQIGHLIKNEKGETIYKYSKDIGSGTNNVAEYMSLLTLLRTIQELNLENVTIFGDSQLVVRQIQGSYKVSSPHLIPLHKEITRIIKSLKGCEIKHVYRENNKEADTLTR
jgi:ribonuclease HI